MLCLNYELFTVGDPGPEGETRKLEVEIAKVI